jgi:hypothetical protein
MDKKLILEAASIACDEHVEKLLPIGTWVKLRNEPIFGGKGQIAIPPLAAQPDCEQRGLYCIELEKNLLIYRKYGEVVEI